MRGHLAMLLLASAATFAGEWEIVLPNRTLEPAPGLEEGFGAELDAAGRARIFGLVQLRESPPTTACDPLASSGIRLDQFLGGTAYIAEFDSRARSSVVVALLRECLRWVGDYRPVDKLDPALFEPRAPASRKGSTEVIHLLVEFHRYTEQAAAEAVLRGFTDEYRKVGFGRTFAIELPASRIADLTAHELVYRVESRAPADGELR